MRGGCHGCGGLRGRRSCECVSRRCCGRLFHYQHWCRQLRRSCTTLGIRAGWQECRILCSLTDRILGNIAGAVICRQAWWLLEASLHRK